MIEFLLKHELLAMFAILEIIPLLYMLGELRKKTNRHFTLYKRKVIKRCVYDKEYENSVASYLYFFRDLGPNTASFSVVTLIVDVGRDVLTYATAAILTVVFIVGIILKEKSRVFTKHFYQSIAEERKKWEQSSEV